MNKNDTPIFQSSEQIDVDEDPPIIHGYCTPLSVEEEEYDVPLRYMKTSKPIAVDSAIANNVWDTIIEEEEEADYPEEVTVLSYRLQYNH